MKKISILLSCAVILFSFAASAFALDTLPPTASLTVNGQSSVAAKVGDVLTYNWSSMYADPTMALWSNTDETGKTYATDPNGKLYAYGSSAFTVTPEMVGHLFTITFIARNTIASASATVNVAVPKPAIINPTYPSTPVTPVSSALCTGDIKHDKAAGDACAALAVSQGQALGFSNIMCVNNPTSYASSGGVGLTGGYDQQCYVGTTNIGGAELLVGYEGVYSPGWWMVSSSLKTSSGNATTNSGQTGGTTSTSGTGNTNTTGAVTTGTTNVPNTLAGAVSAQSVKVQNEISTMAQNMIKSYYDKYAAATGGTTQTPATTPSATPTGTSGNTTVEVTAQTINVRSEPNTTSALAGSKTLSLGDQFSATGKVTGESVSGNSDWWVSTKGNYVWSGGTKVAGTVIATPAKPVGYPFTDAQVPSVSLTLDTGSASGINSATLNANDHSRDVTILNWSSKNIDSATFTTDLEVTKSANTWSRECVPLQQYPGGYLSLNDMLINNRGSIPFQNTVFAGKRFVTGDPCNWGKTRTITVTGYQYLKNKQVSATVSITTNKPTDFWFSYGYLGGFTYTDTSPNYFGAGTWGFDGNNAGNMYYGQMEDPNFQSTGAITLPPIIHSVMLSGSDAFNFSNMPTGMTGTGAIGKDESMGGSSQIKQNRFSIRLNTAAVKPDYYIVRIKPKTTSVNVGYLDLPVIVPATNPQPLDRGPAGL